MSSADPTVIGPLITTGAFDAGGTEGATVVDGAAIVVVVVVDGTTLVLVVVVVDGGTVTDGVVVAVVAAFSVMEPAFPIHETVALQFGKKMP